VFNKDCEFGEMIFQTTESNVCAYFCEQLINSGYTEKERFYTTGGSLIIYGNGVLCFVFALIENSGSKLHRFFLCRNYEGSWQERPGTDLFFAADPGI